jgi:hypothetical protein
MRDYVGYLITPIVVLTLVAGIFGVFAWAPLVRRANFEACGKSCGGIARVEESANTSCKCRVTP